MILKNDEKKKDVKAGNEDFEVSTPQAALAQVN